MAWLFSSGHAVDVVLAVMVLEGLWLSRRPGWTLAVAGIALLPGALMLLAVRAALTGAPWPWIAGCLLLSWPAHLADLRRTPVHPGSA